MTGMNESVKGVAARVTAPLSNVAAFGELVSRVVNRPSHLPGMATFHGYSGYGKTWAATFAANRHKAKYVEVGASWTRKKLVQSLLNEFGVKPAAVLGDMMDQIIETMAIDNLPLIIDEADHLLRRGMIDLVREIHDKSGTPVILIGEEMLPTNLAKYDRVHNRMLDWLPARPADLDDVRVLAKLYAPEVRIEEDLLVEISETSGGRVRRAAVNIERVREFAGNHGLEVIDATLYTGELFSGLAPRRRV